MLNPRTDTDFAHAMQDTTRAGSEQAGNAVQVVADICERAARAGAEILRTNVETAQQVLQSGAEMAAQLTESSVNQFGRALGLSDDGTHTAAQQSSKNIDAIVRSGAMIVEVTQSISRQWTDFARERAEQNFNRFDSLLRCRTPQDFAAVQSDYLRDNLESFLQCARRVAEKSVQVADESAQKVAENVEQMRSVP
jgi:hypothetical protein